MARLAAEAKAGYYPAPVEIVRQIAAVVRPALDTKERPSYMGPDPHCVLDPCCGEGEALNTLIHEWFPRQGWNRSYRDKHFSAYACELEKGRYEKAKSLLWYDQKTVHGDAFGIIAETGQVNYRGATVLYLNPPYAPDKEYKRLEERWLRRFTNLLATDGALIFFVPGYALVDSAETLATWYTDVAVLRLDDAAYSTFKQVVLIARKLGAPRLTPDPAIIATITAPTEKLPILLDAATATGYTPLSATDEDEAATPDTEDEDDADLCAPKPAPQYAKPLLTVQPLQGCGFKDFEVARFDLAGLMAKHRPWHVSKAGGKFAPVDKAEPIDPFMRVCLRTYNVAVSPRASHIAAGIAAGVFNGVRIVSTTPGLPPLYIKGAFTRDYETVETRVNDKGEATSLLQHQKPRLNITVLDTSVSPPLYRTLRSETTITESVSLDDAFTIGDLLHHYGASLLAVLNQRCPTLYSYGTPLRQYDSPRTLFSAQSHATAATLKLLQQPDRSCFLLGEIGSGKSTVSLVSAVTHGAKRILIVAPPHLMDSWRDQAAAVLPGALCVVLSRPSDIELIEAEAPGRVVIGVVSRETAKLGHAYAGLLSCSHCGAVPKLDLPALHPKADPEKHKEAVCLVEQKARETAARLRKRCGAKHYTAKNGAARLAAKLGVAIHTIFPDEEMISSIAPPKLRASMARAVKLGKPRAAAIEIEDRLYPLVAEAARLVCERYSGDGLSAQEGHATHAHALLALILGCSDSDRAGRLALDLLVPHALAVGAHKVRDSYNARAKLMSLIQAILLTMESGVLIDDYAQRLGGPAIDPDNVVAPEPDPAKEGDGDGDEEDEGRSWYRSPSYSMWGAYEKFARYLVEDGGRSGEDAYVHNEYLGYGDGDFLLAGHAPRTNSLQRYALSKLWELAKWGATKPCESVMYTAIPQPRRFPLARYIVKHRPYLFDFLLVDEAHEYANQDSAQSQSVQQLYGLKLPTIILTGSVTNGYASSLFIPLWYLSAAFRAEFKRADLDKFVKRYGYLKRVIDMATGQVKEHGAMSMRKETTKITGQIPGVMPELVLRHLLPLAATIHLEDIEGEEIGEPGSGNVIKLPACEEIVIRVEMNAAQASAAKQLRNSLVTRIKADRFTARRGKLFGQLAELPSMLDRFTVDTGSDGGPDLPGDGRYTIRYPAPDNEEVDSVACLPADTILPKEAELIRVVLAERAAGRRVMVFPWHIALMPRLARLLRAKGLNVAELYSTKVPSKKRHAWIDKNVIGKGVDVLFVNPVAVQTGLNNLVYFHSVVWYENPACNPVVRRQARGRVKRIGQLLDVRSYTLIYEGEGALQGAAHTLLLHKVGIGEAVDGLDPTAALQAAGVGDTDSSLAQGIGAALYKMISQGKA